MGVKIKKNSNKIFILIICAICLLCGSLSFISFNVLAEGGENSAFVGRQGNPTDKTTLFNATNTFNYNGDNNISNANIQLSNRTYQYYNTNESNRIFKNVSTSAPSITVLTHGLNGGAYNWSNNNQSQDFSYNEESLFIKLKKELEKNGGNGANIYWAKMVNNSTFNLYDITNNTSGSYKNNSNVVTAINDVSKHIIIIFESSNSEDYNFRVYEEFNYMLSKIVYDVKLLNGGILPKINLIGHSRGGITNLMYALDHPEMIASMFSIGTPFFGSDTASTELGASFAEGNGLQDIIDRNVYLTYYQRWNANYDRLYSHINAHALGGYSDVDFVFDALIESDDEDIEEKAPDEALTAIKTAIHAFPFFRTLVLTVSEATELVRSALRDIDYDESELESYVQIVADMHIIRLAEEGESALEYFWDNIIHNVPFIGCPYFMNDLLVDLSSQMGKDEHGAENGNYNFKIYTKYYKEGNSQNLLSNPSKPAIVHNLEARDEDFISYILSNVELGQQYAGYIYKQTGNTNATLVGYSGTLLSGEVALPSQINGLVVNAISYDLFKGNGNNITKLIVPQTVTVIEDGAFIGLTNLTEVVFEQGSSLTRIGNQAFSGCNNLSKLEIPRYVNNIEGDTFLYCDKLTNLTVNSNNTSFTIIDGVLFNKAGNILLHYPTTKTNTKYTISSTVTQIGEYAFCDNNNLEIICIQDTLFISEYAFCNLVNLKEIHFESTTPPHVEVGAFDNTRFSMYIPDGYEEDYYECLGKYADNVDSTYEIEYEIKLVCSITGSTVGYANAYYLCGLSLIHIPSKEHYEMEGLYDMPYGQGNKYVSITYNSTSKALQSEPINFWQQRSSGVLYVNWTRIATNISCNAIADGNWLPTQNVFITSGENSTIVAPSIDGYTFDHWEIYDTNYNTATITINVTLHRSFISGNFALIDKDYTTQDRYITIFYNKKPNEDSCVAEGTLITLADGSQVPVEKLTGKERLLVWNLKTGRFDYAPILFIDSEEAKFYKIINLYFSDGTQVKVIDEHAFWDVNLNKYVYLREDASKYIGHYFNKQVTDRKGNITWTKVRLINVNITEEYTKAWSPVTEKHLCLYVNGMLSMPGGIEGLTNIFEVDRHTMKINRSKYIKDIKTYGIYTYEEFYQLYQVPKEMFDAVDGQYLKVAIGKGLLTHEELSNLIVRYSKFFE